MSQQVDNSNFSMCFVIPEDDVKVRVLHEDSLDCHNFIYHRIDLVGGHTMCSYMDRMATFDGLGVKFTTSAFQDPLNYMFQIEYDSVIRYKFYMEGNDQYQGILKVAHTF